MRRTTSHPFQPLSGWGASGYIPRQCNSQQLFVCWPVFFERPGLQGSAELRPGLLNPTPPHPPHADSHLGLPSRGSSTSTHSGPCWVPPLVEDSQKEPTGTHEAQPTTRLCVTRCRPPAPPSPKTSGWLSGQWGLLHDSTPRYSLPSPSPTHTPLPQLPAPPSPL